MPRIDTVRYLGVYFACSRKLKCSLDHAKRSFYRSVTTVFGEVGRLASEDVVLHLVHSTCMHILLYAVEVCPLSQSDIGSLDFAIFRFLMKSFQTNKKDIIDDCCSFLISNCQVNAYITAKSDLIRYTISLEVTMK